MNVLIRPLVTEKISKQNEKGTYGFVVQRNANKVQIRQEVEKMYGVTVEVVRTMNYQGKSKSRYTKSRVLSGRTNAFKKAIVQVADGDIIDFYSGV